MADTKEIKTGNLAGNKGEKGEEAGALDGERELALVRSANAGPAVITYARVGIQKSPQRLDILIINPLDIVIAKVTKFHIWKLEWNVGGINVFVRILDGLERFGGIGAGITGVHAINITSTNR